MKKHLFIFFAALCSVSSFAQTIPSYVPTSGLVGWWPFNGNANDESGNGNNGIVNGATLTVDRYNITNKAYNFNASSIRCIYPGPLGNSSRTVSFWSKTSSNAINGGYIISYGSDNINGGEYGMRLNRNCIGPSIDVSSSAITYYYPNISNNIWHHFLVSFDNLIGSNITSISIYIDGMIVSNICDNTNANSNSINTITEEPITIGRWCNLTGFSPIFFDGDLDDIGIWNRALTQSEVTALYNGCAASITSQPLSQTVNIISSAQFITSSSDPLATYQWQTDLGVGFQNLNSVGQYSGTVNDTLTVSNVTLSNNNQPFRCIINAGSCADTSNVAVLTVNNSSVGVNDLLKNQLFTLYPNPATSQVTIIADAKLVGTTYTICNYIGKSVIEGKINAEHTLIDLGNLSGDIYLISVGDHIKQTFKVIKQ